MPLYNAEQYVAEAIESVIRQTYTNWELIIVNDGSTDQSLTIAKKFESEKVKIFNQENKGQCAANNFGYQQSSGQYIKFFDADDVLSENMLEAQLALLSNSESALASAQWGRFYDDDLTSYRPSPEECWQDMKPIDWICSSWKNGEPMMQCALWLIPRKVLEKSGLWNEELSLINDFEFFTRVILAADEIKFSSAATLYYRSGVSNALSGRKTISAVKSAILSVQLATQQLLEKEDSERTRRVAANCLMNLAYEYELVYPELLRPITIKIKALGGSSVKYRSGKVVNLLTSIFGWKFAKRFQLFYRNVIQGK